MSNEAFHTDAPLSPAETTPCDADYVPYWYLTYEGTRTDVYRFCDLADEFRDDNQHLPGVYDMSCAPSRLDDGDVPAVHGEYSTDLQIPVPAITPFFTFMMERGFYSICTLELRRW